MEDKEFMTIALGLARRGLGNVFPNPAVGCVIVKDGSIVGRGYTQEGGRPHAEIVALKRAQDLAMNATAYVTLEPCCHYGQTNPCTLSLINSGIKRVVIAGIDPDRRVSGKGILELQKAGLNVTCGVMKKESEKLNIGFFYSNFFFRPFITVKIATSLDGKIATYNGESKWITNDLTRNRVHKLRAEYDAIMIGSNTLVHDDPMLNCRIPGLEHRSPIRIIMDSGGHLSRDHNIAKTSHLIETWVITNSEPVNKQNNIRYLLVDSNAQGKVSIEEAMRKLNCLGITRLLIEGGSAIITEFLKKNLVDRLIWCRSNQILGNDAREAIGKLEISELKKCYQFSKVKSIICQDDMIEIFDLKHNLLSSN